MNDELDLRLLLRTARQPTEGRRPARDLWPEIARYRQATARQRWLDLGMAFAVALMLVLFPSWLWLLLYHL